MWKSIAAVAVLFAITLGCCRAQNVEIVGNYSYSVDFNADTATIKMDELDNPTAYMTASLRIELWLTTSPYNGGQIVGTRILNLPLSQFSGAPAYGQLDAYTSATAISATEPMDGLPSAGTYFVTLIISEYTENCGTTDGYCIETWGSFPATLTVPAPSLNFDPAPTASGGGGSLDWVCIALLGALLVIERTRHARRHRRH